MQKRINYVHKTKIWKESQFRLMGQNVEAVENVCTVLHSQTSFSENTEYVFWEIFLTQCPQCRLEDFQKTRKKLLLKLQFESFSLNSSNTVVAAPWRLAVFG